MNRRDCLRLVATGALGAAALPHSAMASFAVPQSLDRVARPLWQAWKEAFLASEGRVIDTLQQRASHSEGQGYGMLLATEFDDPVAFRQMFDWTELHLAVRPDGLLAWRWLPGQRDHVPDRNNASDGDLFYAWALVRAARQFEEPRYLHRATDVARALASTCIVRSPAEQGGLLMLPGAQGFVHEEVVTCNPSYLMPLAMREVAAATGVAALAAAALDGAALLARIADRGLVPDWVDMTVDGWRPSELLPSNTGYEAMRVPLFLVWSGEAQHAAVRRATQAWRRSIVPGEGVPTVLESNTGMVIERSWDPGYRAIAELAACADGGRIGSFMPPFTPDQPYYPATLQLFTMLAANDRYPECVPI